MPFETSVEFRNINQGQFFDKSMYDRSKKYEGLKNVMF